MELTVKKQLNLLLILILMFNIDIYYSQYKCSDLNISVLNKNIKHGDTLKIQFDNTSNSNFIFPIDHYYKNSVYKNDKNSCKNYFPDFYFRETDNPEFKIISGYGWSSSIVYVPFMRDTIKTLQNVDDFFIVPKRSKKVLKIEFLMVDELSFNFFPCLKYFKIDDYSEEKNYKFKLHYQLNYQSLFKPTKLKLEEFKEIHDLIFYECDLISNEIDLIIKPFDVFLIKDYIKHHELHYIGEDFVRDFDRERINKVSIKGNHFPQHLRDD